MRVHNNIKMKVRACHVNVKSWVNEDVTCTENLVLINGSVEEMPEEFWRGMCKEVVDGVLLSMEIIFEEVIEIKASKAAIFAACCGECAGFDIIGRQVVKGEESN